jgi:integrase
MPYLRKLPSGRWQATVRHPSGRRISKTDALKKVVAEWGREEEAKYARGDVRDPRAGRVTVAEWYERWSAARSVDPATAAKTASNWRTHCGPKWSTWPMDSITRMEAQAWANVVRNKRRARHKGVDADRHDDVPTLAADTVHQIVNVMSALFEAACNERPPITLSNPFVDLELPTVPPAPIDFYSHDEAEALLAVLERDYPPQWAALVGLGMWVGLRPGEIFGLHGDRVNWLRHDLEVTRVLTRVGLREYPKSRKSHRVVPVPKWQMPRLSALMTGRPLSAAVFTAPKGGLVDDSDFRLRIWYPALETAGVRRLPPRAMRHTAASWLVQDGVDLYRVQALLGHESYATTQRYAHLAPSAHDKVRESWRRTSDARVKAKKRGQRTQRPLTS